MVGMVRRALKIWKWAIGVTSLLAEMGRDHKKHQQSVDVDMIGLDIHIESWDAATDQSKKEQTKTKNCMPCEPWNPWMGIPKPAVANDDEHKQSTVAIG